MSTVSSSPPRESLALPRFLAVILFAGSFCFGMGAIAGLFTAITGEVRVVVMLAGVGLTAWMLGWLGMVIWSGRMIPRWFIASFGILIVAGSVVAAMFSHTWAEALALVSTVPATALGFRSVMQNYPGQSPKPKTFDEI